MQEAPAGSRIDILARALAVGLTLGLVVALAGCARTVPGSPPERPHSYDTGAQDPVIRIESGGGFSPDFYLVTGQPSLLVTGDGGYYTPAAVPEIYPGPALNPINRGVLSPGQVVDLLADADESGLLAAEPDYGLPGITDLPTTVVTITADGRTRRHAAYALGEDDGLTSRQRSARRALSAFIERAQTVRPAGDGPWRPERIEVHTLSDAGRIGEDIAQPVRAWPIGMPPGDRALGCVVISGEEARVLFADLARANALTPWSVGGAAPLALAFRAVLPGETACG